ncbi:MAG: DEAD/DEAH box helicase [Pseudomonadota bacterium]
MQTHDPRRSTARRHQQYAKTTDTPHMKPEAEPVLKNVFARIGKPESAAFAPDAFQREALRAVQEADCLVVAPTGSGKTWIAQEAIRTFFDRGKRCWYASPLKALSNAKWVEFGGVFGEGQVGILTGDTKENADAPIIVGTTEILRNQLYDVMHRGEDMDCDLVVLDEAHFLGDPDRGVVWEEILIYLPVRVNVLLLSATIGNADEIGQWLNSIRKKPCTIIREEKRPVPLYPLFLHPSGRIMPYLEKQKLYGRIAQFAAERSRSHGRRGAQPHFGEIIDVLERFQLLPAIFFLKSRSDCDAALKTCRHDTNPINNGAFDLDLEEQLSRSPYLRHHKQLRELEHARVAAHHGGQLPAWKFLVETMMKRGHLNAIFATSTVAAGVNFPARTIVLLNSDLFNGHEFSPLRGTDFHQMTGRDGRRGKDQIGFLVVIPGRFMDLVHIRKLLFREPEDIMSQIKNDFSMILNLLLSHTPMDIRDIFEKSLASFQLTRRGTHAPTRKEGINLWNDFLMHLKFLKAEGFVDGHDRLTETGLWASKLRLDQPLLIAECLQREAFPRQDEKLLAAVVAPFVYDGDHETRIDPKKMHRRLAQACLRVARTLNPLSRRMDEAGFAVNPMSAWTSVVMYQWALGRDWDEIIQAAGIADGDMAMLVLRTADNLRQIISLRQTHPDMADLALKAREAILREPVVFE